MASAQYGKYYLISRPFYDPILKAWRAYASVTRDDGNLYYHRLKDLEETFQTEEEALVSGFAAARAWIIEYEAGRDTPSK